MLEVVPYLASAAYFGAVSRAAFHETGIIAPGPILRLLQWGPLPFIILLSSFDVDRESYGQRKGGMRLLAVFLGFAFAAVSVISLYLIFAGD